MEENKVDGEMEGSCEWGMGRGRGVGVGGTQQRKG